MDDEKTVKGIFKKEIGLETLLFPLFFVGFFALFAFKMGLANTIRTMMNTAYALLMDTVLYLTAICVIMGALSALLSEFGFVSLINRLLYPIMKPVYGLPGAASLGIVTTFLSDNPAILALAEEKHFRHYFKQYQFPALTNLGTAFGMGLIVCTYMFSLSNITDEPLGAAVLIGLVGAVIGSIVSTRLMLIFTRKFYGDKAELPASEDASDEVPVNMRPIREGGVGRRAMGAILEGGHNGVKMGVSIVPGVLVICTVVMMLTNGSPGAGAKMTLRDDGSYVFTAEAQGIREEGAYSYENGVLTLTDAEGREFRAEGEQMKLRYTSSAGSLDRSFSIPAAALSGSGEAEFDSLDDYTGGAYEGVRLLPWLADKANFILRPLFGFSSPEAVGVPVTALGAAGAAITIVPGLVKEGLAHAGDIAVFTAMCMCWSGYLSTHTSMMDSLNCKELIGKAILCHTVGGICAGISAHWLYVLISLLI